jgi:hypothetical protein
VSVESREGKVKRTSGNRNQEQYLKVSKARRERKSQRARQVAKSAAKKRTQQRGKAQKREV